MRIKEAFLAIRIEQLLNKMRSELYLNKICLRLIPRLWRWRGGGRSFW